jgi:hypothetical protein|tara:strand:- start:1058 stop:1267 length:210 start_codon:yes stop_codon:yes gene_type:complete
VCPIDQATLLDLSNSKKNARIDKIATKVSVGILDVKFFIFLFFLERNIPKAEVPAISNITNANTIIINM